MNPIHFAVVGVVALSFGLVTPPYGLCLLIASAIGGLNVREVLRDVAIFLLPMLAILLMIVVIPMIAIWVPGLAFPQVFK